MCVTLRGRACLSFWDFSKQSWAVKEGLSIPRLVFCSIELACEGCYEEIPGTANAGLLKVALRFREHSFEYSALTLEAEFSMIQES